MVTVKTFRNNVLEEISINDLVLGDHVLLQSGDNVPADGFLVSGHVNLI